MLNTILWVLVGIVVGWNLPQPSWAAELTAKIKNRFNK
jgi:hypothetical protein